MRKVTERKAIEGDLEDYIGGIVSTNLTATCRAKLVAVSRELCLFETSETPYEVLREKGYNCVVGELFTLSTRDVRFMYFPPEENKNIAKDGKTIIKTRKRAKCSS
jgi:hypothetical protein